MPVDVLSEIEIARPRGVVAAYACDPDNAPSWYENYKAVDWRSSKPLEVGSRVAFVAQVLGRDLAYTYEVQELVAGERLVMNTDDGPFPLETTYTFEDATDGATRMTLRHRGEPAGLSKVSARMAAAAMRRTNHKNLRALKAILETPAGESWP